jgi:hypothetical protein
MADFCEEGNELLVSIKGGKFLDQLDDCSVFKEDPVP